MQQRTRHPTLEHLDALVGQWETEARHQLYPGAVAHCWCGREKQTRKELQSMGNHNDRPDGPARLDRRDILRRSAGLAVPAAVALSGVPRTPALTGAAAGPAERGARLVANDEGFDRARLDRLRETLAGHVERGRIPGLVTGVSRGGEVVVDAIGTLAFDSEEPMRRDTIFRIASVTKPITAVAALILVEEGVLRLDDSVDDLLPELADRQVLRAIDAPLDDTVPANRPITLRDLLTFRSGYGAIFTPPEQSPLAQALVEAGVAAGPVFPSLPPR